MPLSGSQRERGEKNEYWTDCNFYSSGYYRRCYRNQEMCGVSDRRFSGGGHIHVWEGFSASVVYVDPGCACRKCVDRSCVWPFWQSDRTSSGVEGYFWFPETGFKIL